MTSVPVRWEDTSEDGRRETTAAKGTCGDEVSAEGLDRPMDAGRYTFDGMLTFDRN